jgi:cytochrome c-type biogenesis protein CcmH/NrfG
MMRIPANMVISPPEQLGDLFAMIGEILRPNKQFEAAKAAYVMAVEMNCDLPEVHRGLAEVFLRDNHPEKSLEHLQTALKLSDNHAPFCER